MSDKKLPKAGELFKEVMHIHINIYGQIAHFRADMSDYGNAFVGTAEVSFIMPSGDPVKSMVDSLEKAIEKEKAESHVRINGFKDKIQQLLAIGCDGGVE